MAFSFMQCLDRGSKIAIGGALDRHVSLVHKQIRMERQRRREEMERLRSGRRSSFRPHNKKQA